MVRLVSYSVYLILNLAIFVLSDRVDKPNIIYVQLGLFGISPAGVLLLIDYILSLFDNYRLFSRLTLSLVVFAVLFLSIYLVGTHILSYDLDNRNIINYRDSHPILVLSLLNVTTIFSGIFLNYLTRNYSYRVRLDEYFKRIFSSMS